MVDILGKLTNAFKKDIRDFSTWYLSLLFKKGINARMSLFLLKIKLKIKKSFNLSINKDILS